MNDGENRSVCPHTERDREYDNHSEAGVFQKHPAGVTQIVKKRFEERKPAPLAIDFFCLFNTAELNQRFATRFYAVHAGAQIVFDVHLEMAFHFRSEIVLAGAFAKEFGL